MHNINTKLAIAIASDNKLVQSSDQLASALLANARREWKSVWYNAYLSSELKDGILGALKQCLHVSSSHTPKSRDRLIQDFLGQKGEMGCTHNAHVS